MAKETEKVFHGYRFAILAAESEVTRLSPGGCKSRKSA